MVPSANALVRAALVVSFVSGLCACSMFSKQDADAAPIAGVVSEKSVTATATVLKVDLPKRIVTLKGENGNVFDIKCGEQVKNLPQVKVGDKVTTTYYESVAYEVHKPGTAEVGVKSASGLKSAEPGQKPAGVAADVIQVTATIVSIDKATPSVTLKRPDGEVVAVHVRDPKKLEGVAVGDLVEITYTQALAIVVAPAK